MTRFFNSFRLNLTPETKKERMEQEEQRPPTEHLFPTIPFFNGKKELNPILLHFSQTGALF